MGVGKSGEVELFRARHSLKRRSEMLAILGPQRYLPRARGVTRRAWQQWWDSDVTGGGAREAAAEVDLASVAS